MEDWNGGDSGKSVLFFIHHHWIVIKHPVTKMKQIGETETDLGGWVSQSSIFPTFQLP